MIYGYARVSTGKQSLERQLTNILKVEPEARIYKEKFTGTTADRPEWKKLKEKLQPGDTVIFDSVSRMSRNAAEGFADYKELFNRDIILVFIKEPYCNTEVYKAAKGQKIKETGEDIADIYIKATNQVLEILAERQITIAFEQSEKEVNDLHKRISEGMREAEAGKRISEMKLGITYETKKSKEAKEKMINLCKDFGGQFSDIEVMQMLKLSRNTFYKYKREIKS